MNILRVPPYPLQVSYSVPEPNTEYVVLITDTNLLTEESLVIESNEDAQVVIELSGEYPKYDQSYAVQIFDIDDEVVVEDNLNIERPYIDSAALSDGTVSDIAKYQQYEMIARYVIDSLTNGGFYYKKLRLQLVGLGADYLPVYEPVKKLLALYENNLLVWDPSIASDEDKKQYGLSADKTAITVQLKFNEEYNKDFGKSVDPQLAMSDSFTPYESNDSPNVYINASQGFFPKDFNYVAFVASGYQVVPLDVQEATELLVKDMACGNLDYHQRYIKKYDSGSFVIDFDPRSFSGTGNLLVDKILSKYMGMSVSGVGVL